MTWIVNLKTGEGSIKQKKGDEQPDLTFELSDDDMVALASRQINPQSALVSGKMKIKGDLKAILRFSPELLPPIPKL